MRCRTGSVVPGFYFLLLFFIPPVCHLLSARFSVVNYNSNLVFRFHAWRRRSPQYLFACARHTVLQMRASERQAPRPIGCFRSDRTFISTAVYFPPRKCTVRTTSLTPEKAHAKTIHHRSTYSENTEYDLIRI